MYSVFPCRLGVLADRLCFAGFRLCRTTLPSSEPASLVSISCAPRWFFSTLDLLGWSSLVWLLHCISWPPSSCMLQLVLPLFLSARSSSPILLACVRNLCQGPASPAEEWALLLQLVAWRLFRTLGWKEILRSSHAECTGRPKGPAAVRPPMLLWLPPIFSSALPLWPCSWFRLGHWSGDARPSWLHGISPPAYKNPSISCR